MLLPLASILGEITHAVTGAVGDHGLYAVFALLLVDAVQPAASEAVLVFAGALAAGAFAGDVVLAGYEFPAGLWAFVAIATAGTLGYTVGSVAGWAIGITGGRRFVERYGRWLHLGPDKLERAERWFARWGDSFVLVCRLVPVVRSFVAVPAGVVRMRSGATPRSRSPAPRSGASRSPVPGGRWERTGSGSITPSATSTTPSGPRSFSAPRGSRSAGARPGWSAVQQIPPADVKLAGRAAPPRASASPPR